ncbi:MAG: heavy metal transport/detoxification protein [Tannerellaceae bacterium]|nr:heavy metal transport/detoxification protein [Tannerellaceae bacterium]MCD8264365.1 heavy metal transport/detoxification protein [Tannerellaceae bacterium]
MMRFKTNAKCQGCVTAIGNELNKIMRKEEWTLDLFQPDKVLTVTAEVTPEAILHAVTSAGLKAEQIL